jgi:hypothetical protein
MAWFSSSSLLALHVPIRRFKRWRGTVSILSRLATHGTGQSLPAAKNHFGWEVTDRPGNERDYDRADVFENCIACQDHDWSATDWLG